MPSDQVRQLGVITGRKRKHLSILGSAQPRSQASAWGLGGQTGRKVHTDMDMWTEIRRKVLVEGASKRSILRDYGIGHQVLAKILSHPQPSSAILSPLTTRWVGHGRSPSWVSSWASSTMRIPFRSSGPRRPSRSSPGPTWTGGPQTVYQSRAI